MSTYRVILQLPDFFVSSGIELIPQSITTAPGLIQLPGTKFAFPTPTTKMSAVCTTESRLVVFEWHTVTVQSLHFNSSDIGVPTILLRPKLQIKDFYKYSIICQLTKEMVFLRMEAMF